jgi:hypothetical protein
MANINIVLIFERIANQKDNSNLEELRGHGPWHQIDQMTCLLNRTA